MDLSPSSSSRPAATLTLTRLFVNDAPAAQLIPRTYRSASKPLTFNLLIRDPGGIYQAEIGSVAQGYSHGQPGQVEEILLCAGCACHFG